MRKSLAAAVVLFLCCSPLFAQFTKGKPAFGVKSGINISTFRPAVTYENYDADLKLGFVLGAFVDIPVSARFSIQPEFLYSQMGARVFDGMNNFGNLILRYNYFSIPILAKYKITSLVTVVAGVQNDLLIRGRQEDDLGHKTTVTNTVKDYDFVYTAGVEFWVNKKKNLVTGARYMHGSQDVSISNENSTFFNQGVQVTIGYKLGKKMKKIKAAKK